MKDNKNIKVCLVGSSGGHLTHLYMLKPFWNDKDHFWVTFDKEDARSLLEGEKMYPCYYPTNRSLKALIKNTKIAWNVLHKEKPDLIISCGAAVAAPFFYIGKMMGAKLVYIEVFDRIDKPTMTGKMVYPIVDKFVVQWEEQRKVYLDTYIEVEKIVTTNEIIFEPQYYDELVSHQAIIKLAASNAVIRAYSDYMRFVFDVACPARKWISENHPESCKDNFEYVYDEDGNEHEIAHITEDMLKSFDAEYEKYKKEHVPEAKKITSKVDSLLNVMRADLGNEAYITK